MLAMVYNANPIPIKLKTLSRNALRITRQLQPFILYPKVLHFATTNLVDRNTIFSPYHKLSAAREDIPVSKNNRPILKRKLHSVITIIFRITRPPSQNREFLLEVPVDKREQGEDGEDNV